ncbi:MAG: tripartite tricarboxylate transporter substrate binding protein [Burkholderiaceae bacterium]|nr:tripartite tricarboxylate transporter substrate binding protein [Burkholderiaceae bacterium]
MKVLVHAALLLAAVAASTPAPAQDSYPSRRIQLVIPFATGNGVDQLGRRYAEVLRAQVNQPIVVENRDGAGGIIGGAYVARSAADAYTVMIAAHPPFAIATLLQKDPSYDAIGSFAPVAKVGAVPLVAVAAPSMPFRNWQEMADYFKANPDKANYAASGVGSPGQLFTQLIKLHTGLPMQEISYKSTAQAMTDVLSGQVQFSLVSYAAAISHIKAGTLRALAVGSAGRLPGLPEVPTLAELINQPGFEATVWYGFQVPAGTPADRIDKLYDEIARASADSRVQELMTRAGITPELRNPQQFAASIRADIALARRMIEVARISPQ